MIVWPKVAVFTACLLPLLYLVVQGFFGRLGPDPGEIVIAQTGQWALRLLLLTLAVAPLQKYVRRISLVRYRRMLGLYSWFYASMHLLVVLGYVLGWSWRIFLEEFRERPYMALGICAWMIMVPLGFTSTQWAMRRLGKHWKSLHRTVYLCGFLACWHFLWVARADYAQPLFYLFVYVLLMLPRVRLLRGSRQVTAAVNRR